MPVGHDAGARDHEYAWGRDEAHGVPMREYRSAANSWASRAQHASILSARAWHCAWLLGFHEEMTAHA